MWDNAPIGTKVNWRNNSLHARNPWDHENAVKTRKGSTPDQARYDAYPLGPDRTVGKNLSEDEIRRRLAEASEDFPGKPFVITDRTLAALRAESVSPDFITSVEGLKEQTFIGRKAFGAALADAVQILNPLKAQNLDRFIAIMNTLYLNAHIPATEEEKQQYVDKYVLRHELQIPK